MTEGTLLEDLAAAERRVWDALVAGDAAADGVYPDGVSGRAEHVAQLAGGPTVRRYSLWDMRALALGPEHGLLVYRARYVRAGGTAEEEMYVSSIWRRRGDGWVNLFSQDTPATGAQVP